MIARIRPIALDTVATKHGGCDLTLRGTCQGAIENLKGAPKPNPSRRCLVKRIP